MLRRRSYLRAGFFNKKLFRLGFYVKMKAFALLGIQTLVSPRQEKEKNPEKNFLDFLIFTRTLMFKLDCSDFRQP